MINFKNTMQRQPQKPGTSPAALTNLAVKMKDLVTSLRDLSESLRDAIIKRDVNTVWQILAKQQDQLNEFDKHNRLWSELAAGFSPTPELREVKAGLDAEIEKLRTIGQTNLTLVNSFLAVISKALRNVGANIAKKTNVYGKTGKMQCKSSSLLLCRVG
jgi:hypothetical protein